MIRVVLDVPLDRDWLARQADQHRATAQLAVLLEERALDAVWHVDGVVKMAATGEIFQRIVRPPR